MHDHHPPHHGPTGKLKVAKSCPKGIAVLRTARAFAPWQLLRTEVLSSGLLINWCFPACCCTSTYTTMRLAACVFYLAKMWRNMTWNINEYQWHWMAINNLRWVVLLILMFWCNSLDPPQWSPYIQRGYWALVSCWSSQIATTTWHIQWLDLRLNFQSEAHFGDSHSPGWVMWKVPRCPTGTW